LICPLSLLGCLVCKSFRPFGSLPQFISATLGRICGLPRLLRCHQGPSGIMAGSSGGRFCRPGKAHRIDGLIGCLLGPFGRMGGSVGSRIGNRPGFGRCAVCLFGLVESFDEDRVRRRHDATPLGGRRHHAPACTPH
jgi:hypothetical protein